MTHKFHQFENLKTHSQSFENSISFASFYHFVNELISHRRTMGFESGSEESSETSDIEDTLYELLTDENGFEGFDDLLTRSIS